MLRVITSFSKKGPLRLSPSRSPLSAVDASKESSAVTDDDVVFRRKQCTETPSCTNLPKDESVFSECPHSLDSFNTSASDESLEHEVGDAVCYEYNRNQYEQFLVQQFQTLSKRFGLDPVKYDEVNALPESDSYGLRALEIVHVLNRRDKTRINAHGLMLTVGFNCKKLIEGLDSPMGQMLDTFEGPFSSPCEWNNDLDCWQQVVRLAALKLDSDDDKNDDHEDHELMSTEKRT
jgi:hypothetical protein